MSKITNRDTAPRDRGSVEDRLARLLDTPFLARVVPHLPPETLHQLIRYRGLEACGELVASATPAQLTVLLDLDLWRHARPGRAHLFDVDRFGQWLEVLVDTGSSVAARTVAALDKNLVVTGLSRYVRVFDPGIFEPTAQSDDEPTARHEAMREGDSMHADATPVHDSRGDRLECELAGYIVRARRTDAWDAIVTLLAGAAPPRCHDRMGAPAIATRLRDARRRARLPRDGATGSHPGAAPTSPLRTQSRGQWPCSASSVSPTAFDFISTAAQIGEVRIFMRKLPDLLAR